MTRAPVRTLLAACALLAPAAVLTPGAAAVTTRQCGGAHLLGSTFDSITVRGASCREGTMLLRVADRTPTGPIAGGKSRVKYGPYRGLVTWLSGDPVPGHEHDFVPVLHVTFGATRVVARYQADFFNER